jgi:uncharacterized protein involved in outer membrane biogenesis
MVRSAVSSENRDSVKTIAERLAPHLERLARRGRARTLAIWAGSLLAAYAIAGFLVAPPIVRNQVESNLTERLGRKVAVERVRINPFALSASVQGFSLKETDGSTNAVAFEELYVNFTLSSLFRLAPVIEDIRLAGPYVRVVRNEDKSYSFQDIIDRFAGGPPSPPGPPPRFAVYNIALSDGSIEFDDRPDKAQHVVSDLQIGIPFVSSLPSEIDINVQPHLTAKVSGTKIELLGETKPLKDTRETKLRIDIDELPLAKYFDYVPVPLRFRIPAGSLSTRLELSLSTRNERLSTLTVSGTAGLKNFVAQRSDGTPLLAVGALDVDLEGLDLVNRRAGVRSVRIESPKIDVVRRKNGELNWAALAPEKPTVDPVDAKDPFLFSVAGVKLSGGTVRVLDEGPAKPFRFNLDNVSLDVAGLDNAPEAKAAVRLGCDTGAKGKLAVEGSLQLTPLRAEGKIDLAALQLGAFAPYVEEVLEVMLSGGALSTKGQFSAGARGDGPMRVAYRADASIANFASLDKPTSQDLLRWKLLAVRGIDFEISPLKLAIDQMTLSDFFSRLIVNPDGTLNMQTLGKKQEPEAAPKPAETAAEKGPPPNVRIGRIALANGRVNFSDFFVKPNYSIALTDVAGGVTEMTPEKPGDVELRGRIHETAPLEIAGRVNTLAADLFADIKASARDIELSPLTPYSVKYVGYGIQKGKLSVKIAYLIDKRKLTAENNIYIDQLTFGERMESPTATTLPVLFAVALMKDKNGVIDLDLPIGGSLDDPQFSVGGIVVKALVNLITKAVTSPFALIGALVGGGEELAFLEFDPGSAALDADDETKLKALAKALDDRPGLKLDVSGRTEPGADGEVLKRAAVDREVKAAKLKETGGKAIDETKVAPEEYEKYLTAAYRAAKFERPRNAVGLLKDLPVAEMEQLMLANSGVGDNELRQLGNARAQVAKTWLVETGKIAADRVFIVSSKTGAEGIKDQGKPTRADFSLK